MSTVRIRPNHLHDAQREISGRVAGDALEAAGVDPGEFETAAAPHVAAILHRDREEEPEARAVAAFSYGFTLGIMAARKADAEAFGR